MPPEIPQNPQMPPMPMEQMPPAPQSPDGIPSMPEGEITPGMVPQEEMMPEMPSYNPNPVGDGKPYFMGDHALIKFSGPEEGLGPETFWLVTKTDQTIRPFESEMALDAAFGQDLQTALQKVVVIDPPVVDEEGDIQEGVLTGFTILGPEYAIMEDGTSKPLDFSNHQLKSRYGKPINEELEDLAVQTVDSFLNLLSTSEDKTKIPNSFINKIKKDERQTAFYISAMAYGDYTLDDIYADIVQRFNDKE